MIDAFAVLTCITPEKSKKSTNYSISLTMLPIYIYQTRTCLSRLPTSIFRTQGRAFHSTSSRGPSSPLHRNVTRYYIAIGSVVSLPGLWWITKPNQENKPPQPGLRKEPKDQEQVTRILSQEAYSVPVTDVPGVRRHDGTQVPSNSPCEDRFLHGKFASPWDGSGSGSQCPWMAWGVMDGHAGWQTAEFLEEQLLHFVQRSLQGQVKSSLSNNGEEHVSAELVQSALSQAFVDLDDSIMKAVPNASENTDLSLQEKVKKLAPAWAGSCALLSVYDPITSTLHVACTGDSRAVLGQKQDGKWEATPLSVDQTGSNADEIARLNREHPGEDEVVKDGRVLGMIVSRAFGDSRWKWPLDVQEDVKQRFYGPSPLPPPKYNVRTPPYLTAEPVVTSTKIDPAKPSFLILATDGLWDMLSSQQGVDLVGKWLESQPGTANREAAHDSFDFSHFRKGDSWNFVEERTRTQDDNAAVHLARNVLGGNHQELIAGRLAFSPPFSRRVRDDITVQVVFFGLDLE